MVLGQTTLVKAERFFQGSEFLPVHQAFKTNIDVDNEEIQVSWRIEPGYYLYDDSLEVELIGESENIVFQEPVVSSSGEIIEDEFKGSVRIYRYSVTKHYPFAQKQPGEITVRAIFQGCAEAGLCYPKSEVIKAIYIPQ